MLSNLFKKNSLSCFINLNKTAVLSNLKMSTKIRPIINKTELDNIDGNDPRHYELVNHPDGYESNAMSYNPRIHKFIKVLMRKGDSNLSRKLVEGALYNIKLRQIEKFNKLDPKSAEKQQIELNPTKIFLNGLDNCKPIVKVISIRKGGVSYQVPVPMAEKSREFLATKLVIESSNEKDKLVRFKKTLASELLDANLNQGKAIKKKTDIHKLAEANRAYAHYKWVGK